MIKNKKAVKVSDTEDLIQLFSSIKEDNSEVQQKEPQQLSFEDYLKNK